MPPSPSHASHTPLHDCCCSSVHIHARHPLCCWVFRLTSTLPSAGMEVASDFARKSFIKLLYRRAAPCVASTAITTTTPQFHRGRRREARGGRESVTNKSRDGGRQDDFGAVGISDQSGRVRYRRRKLCRCGGRLASNPNFSKPCHTMSSAVLMVTGNKKPRKLRSRTFEKIQHSAHAS